MSALRAPDLAASWEWLSAAAEPASVLILWRDGLSLPGFDDVEKARGEVLGRQDVSALIAKQRADGSWGDSAPSRGRILSTLWASKALIDVGMGDETPAVRAAMGYLSDHAMTEDGYFSTTGDERGVLACYVGLAMRLFSDTGRPEWAAAQLEWLTRYQQVCVEGRHRRDVSSWGHGLEHRYGGCFAQTTCVIGLVRAAEAFSRGRQAEHREAFDAIRSALLERQLMLTRDGARVLSLTVPGGGVDRWTSPGFPSDWRIDLADVIHALSPTTAPLRDNRAQRAIDTLMAWRLPNGSWARGWHAEPSFMTGLGASRRGQGNAIVTAKAVVALSRLAA